MPVATIPERTHPEMKKTWMTLLALMACLSLVAAACGDDESDSSGSGGGSETTEESASGGGDAPQPVGEACGEIPTEGEGSSAGMADDPTATAASNNPILSTLVDAVTAAELGDTLNDTSADYTVFAPFNGAFEKIPADDLAGLLEPEMKDTLTDILTYHVFAGEKLDIDALAEKGSLEMVNGDTVEVAAEGDTLTVNGETMVICGNVTTANATVHVIDTVLTPPA